MAAFADAVVAYRRGLNASVTSWGRTDRHNKRIGGHPKTRHLRDLAVDVVYDELPPVETATRLAGELGLTVTREWDHDHLQPNN